MEFLNIVDTEKYWFYVNILHSLILGPMLAYTGWNLLGNEKLNPTLQSLLPYIGAIVIGYHSIRAYQKYQRMSGEGASVQDMVGYYPFQVNLAHLLFIGPLIAWVGYKLSNGRVPTQLEKLLLLILGSAGTVYHAISAYRKYY